VNRTQARLIPMTSTMKFPTGPFTSLMVSCWRLTFTGQINAHATILYLVVNTVILVILSEGRYEKTQMLMLTRVCDVTQSRLLWHHHLHHHDVHRLSFLQCSLAQSGLRVRSHSREMTMTTLNLRCSSTTCLMMFLDHSMGRSVDMIMLSTVNRSLND